MITLFDQLKAASAKSVRGDLLAGLTVAIMVIPQGMAYAMLAGLPPVYGLYAALVPVMVYPFFGTSRQLSVGPVALVSIIVLEGLSKMATPGSAEFVQLALLTSLIAGVIQIVLSALRMGFLVNFLSEPVIKGFTAAAALIIAVSQVPQLLGISVERTSTLIGALGEIFSNIQDSNLPTLILGLVGIAIIVGLRKIRKSLPGGLVAVVVTIVLVMALNLESNGVQVVGEVRKGVPPFTWIDLDLPTIMSLLPLALIICIISFIESLAIAKTISARHHNYPIDANKELLGLGMAKVAGAFFGAYPNTGSFTRSAVNDEAGASSGLASIFTGLIILLTLLFFTPLFYLLPKAVLASIVMVAVVGLIDFADAKHVFRVDRKDFYVLAATFLLTLVLGVQVGVFAGVILSVLIILFKTSRPHYAVLGHLDGTRAYRNIARYPEAKLDEDYLIIRYDVDLYFGNAEHFYDSVMKEHSKYPDKRYVIIDMSAIGTVDSTGLHKLGLLVEALHEDDIKLLLAGTRGHVRDALAVSELQDIIGLQNCYLNVHDAVEGRHSQEHDLSNKYAAQSYSKGNGQKKVRN